MPADGDTVITPAQLKAGHERARQQQKHVDAGAWDRKEIVGLPPAPVPCASCPELIQPRDARALSIDTKGERDLVTGRFPVTHEEHFTCYLRRCPRTPVDDAQPARLSGSAT